MNRGLRSQTWFMTALHVLPSHHFATRRIPVLNVLHSQRQLFTSQRFILVSNDSSAMSPLTIGQHLVARAILKTQWPGQIIFGIVISPFSLWLLLAGQATGESHTPSACASVAANHETGLSRERAARDSSQISYRRIDQWLRHLFVYAMMYRKLTPAISSLTCLYCVMLETCSWLPSLETTSLSCTIPFFRRKTGQSYFFQMLAEPPTAVTVAASRCLKSVEHVHYLASVAEPSGWR